MLLARSNSKKYPTVSSRSVNSGDGNYAHANRGGAVILRTITARFSKRGR